MPKPRVLVLRAPGTNCDEETAFAWRLAGAEAEPWHVGRLVESPEILDSFQVLTLPGGFSYGDDLGSGRILASRLGTVLGEPLQRFVERGGLVLGICNGFQVLVKAGLLPGNAGFGPATLAFNDSGHFESRWVRLLPSPGLSPFLDSDQPIELPVAHGEGKFVVADTEGLAKLEAAGQVVLRYAELDGSIASTYPANPNGSPGAVAGVCDPTGRIFGLMPHPERHVDPLHHPRWTRLGLNREGDGLAIFRNGRPGLDGLIEEAGWFMRDAARYVKLVEWSEEDEAFVGQCPGLIGPCCHGSDEVEVYRELCEIVEEWIEIAHQDGRPLPPPTTGMDLARKLAR